MQTLPSSETLLLASNSPPLLRNHGGDDVDIDFGDVFGGPPKRRSKVNNNNNEATRHSFNEAALRRRDVILDDGALITRDDEKPVFGEEPLIRRRFTTDDFFDDIFRVNEKKNETFGSSFPGSRILSPVRSTSLKAESPPTQFSLPAKLMKATEIPTFGSSVTRKKKETSGSPLSRTSSKVDKSDLDDFGVAKEVVTGKGRQFHFSIYKWPNKGVPVVIWGSSRLSSMAKAEDTTTPSYSRSTPVEKAEREGDIGLKEETKTSDKRPVVQTEIGLMPEQAFSGDVSKSREADVKPLRSFSDDKDKGEEIVSEREVKKGKSKAKNMRSSAGVDSRSKKKPQGRRSSLDSPRPEKSSFASSSLAQEEVGKDGVKGKVMDFVKIFSQGGASVGAGEESLGQSSRWRAKENLESDISKDGANAKETVTDQLKKPTSNIPVMDWEQRPSQDAQKKDLDREKKPAQATQKKDSDREKKPAPATQKKDLDWEKKPAEATQKKDSERESVNMKKASNVTEQEERQEPSKAYTTTTDDIDEPIHVNFMVEDITQEENKLEETRNDAEEIKNIDAKIRKWSSGKSGNIRSLLSTLQYILWPGSGWKAVPLMDMIEGNAVRKSYQRALLILHPDKLQQKGASDNQKYMAEKVFELLQEAWDHFNTLGPV